MAQKDINAVRAYWNLNPNRGEWESFEKEYEQVYRTQDWYFKLIDNLEVKDKQILDLGCGQGLITYYVYKKGGDVIGIDIANVPVNKANRRFNKLNIENKCFVGNAEKLEKIKDNYFDIVISLGVLHSTPDIRKAAKEIYRVLKPRGKIGILLYRKYSYQFLIVRLLRLLNYNNWLFNTIKNKTAWPNENNRYSTFFAELFTCPNMNTYSAYELKKIFEGFNKFKFEPQHTGLTRIIDFINLPKSVEKFFYKLDQILKLIFGCYLTFYAEKFRKAEKNENLAVEPAVS